MCKNSVNSFEHTESVYVFDEDLMSLISNISSLQSNLICTSTVHARSPSYNCFVQTILRPKMRPPGRKMAFFDMRCTMHVSARRGTSILKGWGCSSEILKRTSARYLDPVLWAWLEMFLTSKTYQI